MIKETLKNIVKSLPFDFTLNQKYDRQTIEVMKRVLKPNSNAVDVGLYKGEMLDEILKFANNGVHYGFEPIPAIFDDLEGKYPDNCLLYNVALSNEKTTRSFSFVVSNPPYSGFKQRKFDREDEQVEQIEVAADLLDNIIPDDHKIDFIKIDVEGAEFEVLKGGERTISQSKPIIVFEHGLGAADIYNTLPADIYNYFNTLNYKLSTMERWLQGMPAFSLNEFNVQFEKGYNYYFIAYPA